MKRPLILITNDDGVDAQGIKFLSAIAREFGDVVVMAPSGNASGKSISLTTGIPIRSASIHEEEDYRVYSCTGAPADCVKLGTEFFCDRLPDLILSGINHGSNASINVLYSGTMGAVMEATVNGFKSIGFSALDYNNIRFEDFGPYIKEIIQDVLDNGLPEGTSLNVNFPKSEMGPIKGIKVCRESMGRWKDSYEKRIDPQGHPYYWLTGRFECEDYEPGSDLWALENGYVSVVPTTVDYTDFNSLETLKKRYE